MPPDRGVKQGFFLERSRSPSRSLPRSSEAKALADQPRRLAAVGAAPGLLHHRADQGADRLALPRLDLLSGLGLGGDRPVDDGAELAGILDPPSPRRSTIAAGSPPSAAISARTCRPPPRLS